MNNLKFSYFNSLINNIDIDILDHGHILADASWKHYCISSPFNRLYFVIDGEGFVYNNRQAITLSGGNAYLIPANTEFNYVCDSYLEKFYIHFRAELFHGFDMFESLDTCMTSPLSPLNLQYLMEKVKSEKAGDIIFCKAYLLQTVAAFEDMLSQSRDLQFNMACKYRNIFKYLKTNCHAGITIKELADCSGLTASSFSKNFKKDMGLTVKEYMEKSLAHRAKEKLLLTDKLVKEIAYELKFSDEFYFSRFFKRLTGLSPKDYRLKNQVL